jgi:hypothetical protein
MKNSPSVETVERLFRDIPGGHPGERFEERWRGRLLTISVTGQQKHEQAGYESR